MTTNSAYDNSPSFDEVVLEYLTQLDAGQHPSQAEFLERFPRFADRLRRVFSNLDFVDSRLSGCDRAASAEGMPHLRGFKLLEEIGSGSQGIVYRAEQESTKRIVALKVLREGAFASRSDRLRFQREVELASRLDHPNIVAVFESGKQHGRYYYAMQYVEGLPLDGFAMQQSLDVAGTLRLFRHVCGAVQYAHQRGIIHRDIKPSNILVDEDGVVHMLD